MRKGLLLGMMSALAALSITAATGAQTGDSFHNQSVAAAALARAPTIQSGQFIAGRFTASDPGFKGTRWHNYLIRGRAGQVLTIQGSAEDVGRGIIGFKVYRGRVPGGLSGDRELKDSDVGEYKQGQTHSRILLPADDIYTVVPMQHLAESDRGVYRARVTLGPVPAIQTLAIGTRVRGSIGGGNAVTSYFSPMTLYKFTVPDGWVEFTAEGASVAVVRNLNNPRGLSPRKKILSQLSAGSYLLGVYGTKGQDFTLSSTFQTDAARGRALSEKRRESVGQLRALSRSPITVDFGQGYMKTFRLPAVKGQSYSISATSPNSGVTIFAQLTGNSKTDVSAKSPTATSALQPVRLKFVAAATGDYVVAVITQSPTQGLRAHGKTAQVRLE